MRITNNSNIQNLLGVYRKNAGAVRGTSRINQEKDKIELSEKARDFQTALNAYKNLPEIRKDKVEEISKKLQSGTYNPSGEEVVNSIFDRKI
jgi:negative regulator of flagellin synthesis FlgM